MSRRQLRYRNNGEDNLATEEAPRGGIRGPNSALTEFLRQQGINAEEIRQRHLQRLAEGDVIGEEGENITEGSVEQEINEEGVIINVPDTEDDQEEEEEDPMELEMRIAARRKRRAAAGKDSDEYTDSEDEIVSNQPKRKVIGEEETCASCFNKFVINVYSKASVTGGYLCPDCTKIQLEKEKAIKKNQLLSRKKRQRLAVALLDRQDVKLPTLQDLAIKKVTEKIEYVEQFGDIGSINMKKIAKILCRNRSLDDDTLKLFLNPKLEKLEFWDCSKLSKDSYDRIVSYCPNLKYMKLLMCGRFHNDNLDYFAKNLHALTRLELDGPFLISNDSWQSFFKFIGKKLEIFKISNTHRFNDETFKVFLKNCGANIRGLKLSRLDGLKEKETYDTMPMYLTKLEDLEISYPHQEELIDDTMLINLLSINGETLTSLNLDGATGLTDEFLINGIRPFCSSLRKLSLQLLDQITNEGFVGLFHNWDINYGLNEVYLRKCYSLGDEGIIEMILHSATSLVELSINSIKDLTVTTFQIIKCPNLTYLDTGFVRCLDDDILELLSKNCSSLKVIDCYGNNRCTSKAKIRETLKVIGRQSDTV